MKIVCDSCGTKYSISDDKVRGKVFKIRCKKCSHIIVVRGTEQAGGTPAAVAAPAAAAADAGGWHLVVDGDQVGPVSEADIRGRIERGEINGETYIWKEGFADWLKVSAVPEFAGLVAPAEGGVFADGTGSGAVNGDGAAHAPAQAGGGLFGGAPASEEADVFGGLAPAAAKRGGDLFAAPAVSAKSAEEPRWPAASAAPAAHDGGRVENLTGQRHENSVLFSLSNLQSLAMPAPAAKPSVSTTAPTSEGSGLIDIRAMAATTLGSSGPSGGPSFGGPSPADDLPAFGAFSPAAPVLLALPTNSGPPKWIYAVIGVGVLAVIAIAALAVMMLGKKPVVAEQQPAPAASAPAAAPAAAPSAPVAAAAPAPTTIEPDKLPPREEPKAEAKTEAKSEKSEKSDKHHKGDKGKESSSGSGSSKKGGDEKKGAAAAAVAEAPPPAEKKPAKGSLDDLLEGALSHKSSGGGGAAKPKVDDDTPKAAAGGGPLAKGAVVAGMNSVKGKIANCYSQFKVPGMAMVNVVIGKSGKVTSATVTGKFAGTPTGSCVEQAVKTASFPPSDGLTTPYPFQLK